MGTINRLKQGLFFLLTGFFCLVTVWPTVAMAENAYCASVKIEIRQELTLERQAFDAHMRINNGLTHMALTDLSVVISFADEAGNIVEASNNPDNTTASFFIRADSGNINAYDSSNGYWPVDDVDPASSSDLHWLIIPAPGSADEQPGGRLYYVGARLTYKMGGEEYVTEVSPDYIFVKPLPLLMLDYFLTENVYGDDAFSPATEPSVPFTLGVRVKNTGHNTACNLKIDSAQPKIIENDLGLLIGFSIIGSEVNGVTTENSLLVSLGDVEPGSAAVGRWNMICSLSGIFTEFTATVTHADELGGELTSIIDGNPQTHFLLRDVRVDLPGRDTLCDFLATDGDTLRVYESECVNSEWDTVVGDYSDTAGFSGSGGAYTLSFSPSPNEFVYVKVTDPFSEQKIITEVIRSDGKRIKTDNAWLSKERKENPSDGWDYYVNLFDVNSTGEYTFVFDAPTNNAPPEFDYLLAQYGVEGQLLSFDVQAIDPEGVTPRLSVSNLPVGAGFTDNGDGTGSFNWTPAPGQAGSYMLSFRASDGESITMQIVPVTIGSAGDSDNDGMDDAWEMAHFGSLDRDGTGDFDNDGISDLDEYINGTDPTREDYGPSPPTISAPTDGQDVTVLSPDLFINNSVDPDGDTLTYDFEVFSDLQLTNRVAVAQNVAEGVDTTTWTVNQTLNDNTLYYWRVRSFDGAAYSIWTYGAFFVNTANEAPGAFTISRPADGSMVDTVTPVLEVTNSRDVDQDILTYGFEVYADSDLTNLVTSASGIQSGDNGITAWTVDVNLSDETEYFWRGMAVDPDGLQTAITGSFIVSTTNRAPTAPAFVTPADNQRVIVHNLDIVVSNAVDPDSDPLVYDFQIDTVNTFDSPDLVTAQGITEGTDTTAWYVTGLESNTNYFWRASAFDGAAYGPWVTGSFLINPINQAPMTPTLKNPGYTAWVQTRTPELAVTPAIDPDGDDLTYYFEVYTDSEFENPVLEGSSLQPSMVVSSNLDDNTRYFWRALAEDPDGEVSEWMTGAAFFVREYSDVSDNLTVNVTTSAGSPVTDVPVYAFTASGAYTGRKSLTDAGGDALFAPDDFVSGSYKFRVDYMGSQFWTGIITMPGTVSLDKVIDVQTVEVTVSTSAGVVEETPVYLFTADEIYLGLNTVTEADGTAGFTLPVGESFLFRADIMSNRYWSDVTTVSAGEVNLVSVEAGGGQWTVYVKNQALWPMEGINTYLFKDNGAYLNKNGITDVTGAVLYNVPEGTYKVRADYLGYPFWTGDTTVTDDTTLDLNIAHEDVAIDVVGMYQGTADPLEGLNVYLFTEASTYLNHKQITDADGSVVFNLPERAYKVRADFLSQRYWSGVFTWEDRTIEIPMAEVEITVFDGVPIAGVPVYVFTEAGDYLNIKGTTAADGTIHLRLPAGDYKFRADYQSNQFWSGTAQLTADQNNPVNIYTGGGLFTVTVKKSDTLPVVGVHCYAFNQAGTYLGLSGVTDSCGQVSFELSDGDYKFRIDYLGYMFWSEVLPVPDTLNETMIIPHQDALITVNSVYQNTIAPLSGVRTYLFSDSGTYMNQNQTTDANGQVTFNLPEQPYKIRADYLSRLYWSQTLTWQDGVIEIPMAETQITVTGNGQSLGGIPVYVFKDTGEYLNINGATDADGRVSFRLPAGGYKFRADYQGSRYWSAITLLTADLVNPIDISVGGGTFALTVLKNSTESLVGAGCYLFSSAGTYLNMSAVTSSEGQVSFEVADGDYKIRVDYLGYQFWTEVFTVPDTLSKVLTIPHQNVTVTVIKEYQDQTPLSGITVYLFKPSGTYMNQNQLTDANGRVVFYLPEQAYKVRANYMGNQFWSAGFQAADTAVIIDHNPVKVHVHRSGANVDGAIVYLFTASGSYLGLYQITDNTGMGNFLLPERDFKFRADQGSDKVYSSVISVQVGPEQIVEIDLD